MDCEAGSQFKNLLLLLLLHFVPQAVGWGSEGHYLVCKIAEEYLTEVARAAVNNLLPAYAKGNLSAVCSWADDIRCHYHWTSALHYVDTPDFKCNYNHNRDCHDSAGTNERCVAAAILNYSTQLELAYQSSSLFKYNLTEALMFLSHFIGDVHQPLHVGFVGDKGGNTIMVHWYKQKSNLHHVWDDLIINRALKNFHCSNITRMMLAILNTITNDQLLLWEHCPQNHTVCPDLFASESIVLACKFAYKGATPGSFLEDYYFNSRLPVVSTRLAQGGIRLASTLNRIFLSNKQISQR